MKYHKIKKPLLILCCCFTSWITSAQTNVSITVNPLSTTYTIPDDYIGMSHEMSDIGQAGNQLFDSTNTKYVNYHLSMGVKSIRIGANTVDYSIWSNGPRTATTPANTLTTTDVDKFFGFIQKIHARSIFGLNFAGDFNPQLSASEASYIEQKHGAYLHSVEIGNEPDYYHFHTNLEPSTYYYSAWKPQYTQYVNAINATTPIAPISGPTTAHDISTFTTPYSIDFKGKFNLLTHHYYSGQPRTVAGLMCTGSLGELNSMATALGTLAKNAGVIGFRMSEFNSFAGGGAAGVSDRFASALWALDAMYYLSTFNCQGVNFHNANNLASPYTPIQVNSPTAPTSYQPRPICYGIIAFNQGSKGKLTQLTLNTTNTNLRAYSVIGEGHRLYVTIINKDSTTDFNISLNPGDLKYTIAQGMRLTGDALSSNSNVSFAGAVFDANGVWNYQTIEYFSKSGNAFNVSVSRASAVVVTFSYAPVILPAIVQAENFVDSSGITSGPCGDIGGGKAIGHISNGDWTDYEVSVPQRGYYIVSYRVASATNGGNILMEMDGKEVRSTRIPGTGGWNTWITVTDTVLLEEGIDQMKLLFEGGSGDFFNINWVDIEYLTIPVPGIIQVENYNDSLGLVSGPSGDVGGTKALGHISNGDWTTYMINVAQKNYYTVAYRVASGSNGGNIVMIVNDVQVRSTAIPGTGGWGNWITVTDTVLLNAGIQSMKLLFTGGAGDFFNVNWIDIKPIVISITSASALSFCVGGQVLLNTVKANGFTYQWYKNGAIISDATNVSYTANAAGSYTVTVSSSGITNTSAFIVVTVNPNPLAQITPASSLRFCQGGNVVLNANTGTGLTYQWSNGTGTIGGATNASYTASAAGSYSLTITNANHCSSVSQSVTTSVDVLPSVSNAGNAQYITTTSTNLLGNVPISGSGLWSVVYGTGIFSNSSSATSMVNGLVQDSTVLSWTISNGTCKPSSANVIIYKGSVPALQRIQGDSLIASNQSGVSYSVVPVTGVHHHWILPTGAVISSSNTDSSMIVVSFGNTAGNISVTESNKFGSSTDNLQVVVTVTTSIISASSNNYEVRPNPFLESVTVLVKSTTSGSIRIIIKDLAGRLVEDYTDPSARGEYILGDNLDTGMYVLTVYQGNQVSTFKIIKHQ